jgi:23S rRNA (adenine2503-C2)-methyltransferase
MSVDNHQFSFPNGSFSAVSRGPKHDSPPLSALDLDGARAWAREHGLPRYRGEQLFQALSVRGVQSAADITEFPASLREQITRTERLRSVEPVIHLVSPADGAEKALLRLNGGATVETVLIPGRNAGGAARSTVCVSSQVGCPAGCTFCATGLSGFGRNLTSPEIVDQVMYFVRRVSPSLSSLPSGSAPQRITNVVFMGMGEPLLNTSAVREATRRLTDPNGLNLGDRRLTVSTVGIVPQVRKFAHWGGQINLAISLHAPNDELRSQLVPYNRHFPIADLLGAVREYVEQSRRRVSFEYVLLRGVNDRAEEARQLAHLLRPFRGFAHVNLIPWNPFREGRFIRSEGPDAEAFAALVQRGGVNTTIRYSRGLDISAACGQLREQARGLTTPSA